VVQLGAVPQIVDTPSSSGEGQKISRCPQCKVAVWSSYLDAGPDIGFVRVGTLDAPDHLPPDIHIFTSSRQPWVQIPADVPAVAEYYDIESFWPPESLARRRLLAPRIEEYRRSLGSGRHACGRIKQGTVGWSLEYTCRPAPGCDLYFPIWRRPSQRIKEWRSSLKIISNTAGGRRKTSLIPANGSFREPYLRCCPACCRAK